VEDSILMDLWGNLVIADRIGTIQTKELVAKDSNRVLKIYIYKEPNHNRPHVHAYWKNEHKISISISDNEVLAGEFPNKYLKPLANWISKYKSELNIAWTEIQSGNKPELSWAKYA